MTAAEDEYMKQQLPSPELLRGDTGRYPVPDPTALTTEALRREVTSLQVLIEQRITALSRLVDEKMQTLGRDLDGRAAGCVQSMEAIRDVIDANAKGGLMLTDEKFSKVAQQFELVENQRQEQKVDTKSAVDAALIAQKEAVREQTTASERAIAKSETATNKQLEQLAATFIAASDAQRRVTDDLKERIGEVDIKVNAVTSEKRGATDYRTGLYALVGVALAIAAFVIGKGL